MYDFYKLERTRRTSRIRQYVVVTIITIVLAVIPSALIGVYSIIISIAALSPMLFLAFYLNRKLPDVAGTLLLLYITSAIFIGNLYYSTQSNSSYYYIAEYVTLLLVIDTRNKFFLIINNIHIGASMLITQIFGLKGFRLIELSGSALSTIGNTNIILSIFASLYLFYTFIQENIAKENYLMLMHKRIITKNKIIENAQSNLETFIYRSSHNLQGPIRSIMGLYNISTIEDDPEKLKSLIELANTSAQQLDKELSITAQVFKINQHIINLQTANLYEFVADYYKTTDIETQISNTSQFNTLVDKEMLTEGMNNLYVIFEKLRLNTSVVPGLALDITGKIFTFTLSFDSKPLDDKYLNIFFAPYQRDLGFLFGLTSEPYICRRIMDKLHGDVSIHKLSDSRLSFTVASSVV